VLIQDRTAAAGVKKSSCTKEESSSAEVLPLFEHNHDTRLSHFFTSAFKPVSGL
jgi:hypothetical protein